MGNNRSNPSFPHFLESAREEKGKEGKKNPERNCDLKTWIQYVESPAGHMIPSGQSNISISYLRVMTVNKQPRSGETEGKKRKGGGRPRIAAGKREGRGGGRTTSTGADVTMTSVSAGLCTHDVAASEGRQEEEEGGRGDIGQAAPRWEGGGRKGGEVDVQVPWLRKRTTHLSVESWWPRRGKTRSERAVSKGRRGKMTSLQHGPFRR